MALLDTFAVPPRVLIAYRQPCHLPLNDLPLTLVRGELLQRGLVLPRGMTQFKL